VKAFERRLEKFLEVFFIGLAAVILFVAGYIALSLYRGSPDTAGNRTISFASDINRESRQSDFESAYGQLCSALREEISFEEFEASRGERFELAKAVGSGSDSEYLDVDTLDKLITSAWSEMTGFPEGEIFTFRFHLVRDGGRWSVCDGEVRSQEMAGSRFVDFRRAVGRDLFEDAYAQLCRLTRLDVSFARFVETEGRAVVPSRFLDRRGGSIRTASEFDDEDTIDQSITSAWIERSATINGDYVTGRLQFLREDSVWKVCGFEVR